MERSEYEEEYDHDDEAQARRAQEEQKLGEMILNAPIRALEPKAAISVSETTSIRDAIQVMFDKHIGAVLVTHEGRPVGIFTERDVLRRVVLSGVDKERAVKEVMTRDPEMLSLDDGIAFALNRMIVRGFRHIPVLDKATGKPAAVLSVREVVAFIVKLLPGRVLNLPPTPELGIPHSPDGG